MKNTPGLNFSGITFIAENVSLYYVHYITIIYEATFQFDNISWQSSITFIWGLKDTRYKNKEFSEI